MPRITRKTIAHVESVANALNIASNEAWALRKHALTLHRWFEQECGDSNDWCSWCITRDEKTGKPFREVSSHTSGKNRMEPIKDMERAARSHISNICQRNGLHFYIQTDPRGGTLYLSRQPIPENNYTGAIFLA